MENGYVIIGGGEITMNYAWIKSQSNLKDIFRLLDGLSKPRVRSYLSEAAPCVREELALPWQHFIHTEYGSDHAIVNSTVHILVYNTMGARLRSNPEHRLEIEII
jgi:hypothetical protein